MRTRTKLRWISVLQIVLAMALFPVWFFVGPWPGAMTPSEVKEKYGRVVPNHWRAVVVGGGRFSEWPYGTMRDNPVGFAMSAGLLFAILALLLLSAVYARRLKATDSSQPPAELSGPGDT